MDETNTKFSYKASKEKKKKFVRYKEGAELYSMGLTKFQEIARESGAVYKVGNLCLVSRAGFYRDYCSNYYGKSVE